MTLGLLRVVVNALMFLLADWLASDVFDLGLRTSTGSGRLPRGPGNGFHLVGDRPGLPEPK